MFKPDFETVWKNYPNRAGKKNALRHFTATVKTLADFENLKKAMSNYLQSGNVGRGFIKNGSTWFNEWQDWVNPSPTMMKGNAPERRNGNSVQAQGPRQYLCPKCTTKHNEKNCPVCGEPKPKETIHA